MSPHSMGSARSRSMRFIGPGVALIAAILLAPVVAVADDISSAPSPTPRGAKSPAYEKWRQSMSRGEKGPGHAGCFKADYPDDGWTEIPCTTAPDRPYIARSNTGPVPEAVGNGLDWSAMSNSGYLTYSEGSFGTSADVSESSQGYANSYTLQLNSNTFSSPACRVAGCTGWQQYIYSVSGTGGTGSSSVFIQYWLLNATAAGCPASWTYYGGPGTPGCFVNGPAVNVPAQPVTNLFAMTLTGTAIPGGLDQLSLSTGTSIYSTSSEDTVLTLSAGWTTAEFNVFGDGGGSTATFSSGTLISVETMVSNGTTSSPAPRAVEYGFTGELNNLTLDTSVICSVADPNGPYIWFQEYYGATPASACPETPISLAAPTVTTTGPTGVGTIVEAFTFTWPSVTNATYYVLSKNGGTGSVIHGNSAGAAVPCGPEVVVTLSSCDAAGCGWPETVLAAKNTAKACNTN